MIIGRGVDTDLLGESLWEDIPELEVDPGDCEDGAVDEAGVAREAGQQAGHVAGDHLQRERWEGTEQT